MTTDRAVRAHRFPIVLALLLGAAPARAQAPATGAPSTAAAAPAAAPPSRISKVIVYSDRAQVTRAANADCSRGETAFGGLPSTLDTKTLFAEVQGAPGAVLGVSFVEEATGPRPRAEALQKEIRALDEKIAEKNQVLEASSESESRLVAFAGYLSALWGRQSTTPKPPVSSWDAGLDLLKKRADAAAKRRREARAAVRDLYRDRQVLYNDLAVVEQERRRTSYRATAHLRCTGQKTVTLSYVIPNATFTLAYQARIDSRARSVAVVAHALVAQATGEDWGETSLFLSTANLERQNLPPSLSRMSLGTYKPEVVKHVLAKRLEQREHLKASKEAAASSSAADAFASAKDTGGAAGEPDRGLAMQLPVRRKASIPGDGRRVLVPLESRTVAAGFTLEAVPKLYPFVYERVSLKNPLPFTMLPGDVELFRDQAFVGKARSKLTAPGEPLAFSLGVKSDLVVERFTKREELEGPGVFGSKKRLHHRYAIQIGNWTASARRVRVLENIPVSQADEVGVALSSDTTPTTEWRRQDGVLAWDLDLPARSKRTVVIGYTVTLPSSYELEGF
jgi:uncharacterized protein (TIGR02231 family)